MFLTDYSFMFDSILSKNILLTKNFENWLLLAEHYKLPFLRIWGANHKIWRICSNVKSFEVPWDKIGDVSRDMHFLNVFYVLETRHSLPSLFQQSSNLLHSIKSYPAGLTGLHTSTVPKRAYEE